MEDIWNSMLEDDGMEMWQYKWQAILADVARASELDLQAHLEHLTKLCSFVVKDASDEEAVLTAEQEEHFLDVALPSVVRSLLMRVYLYQDLEIPWVHDFIHVVIKVIILNLATPATPCPDGLLDTLYRLFDGSRRYYLSYGDTPITPTARASAFAAPSQPTCDLLVDVVNYFGEMGGFDAVHTRLAAWAEAWSNPADGDVQLGQLEALWMPVELVLHLLTEDRQAELLTHLQTAVVATVAHLSPPRVAQENIKTIRFGVKVLEDALSLSCPSDAVGEVVEPLQMELGLRLLQSTVLEKRLAGLNDLSDLALNASRREYFRSVYGDDIANQQATLGRSGDMATRWAEPAYVAGWLADHGVVDVLFGPALHPELVKRAGDLVQCMATPPACVLSTDHVDAMWRAAVGKHGAVTSAVCDCLAEAAPVFTASLLRHLLGCVRGSLALITADVVRVLEAVSTTVARNAAQDVVEDIAQLLWDASLDGEEQAPTATLPRLLAALSVLLRTQCGWHLRPKFLALAMECVQASRSTPQALYFVHALAPIEDDAPPRVGPPPPDSVLAGEDAPGDAALLLFWLAHRYPLVDILLADLAAYMAAAARGAASPPSPRLEDAVLHGRHPHRAQVSQRVSFLRAFLRVGGGPLTAAQLDSLWDSVMREPLTSAERGLGMGLILEAVPLPPVGGSHAALLHPDALTRLFATHLPPMAAASEQTFAAFAHVFKAVNAASGRLAPATYGPPSPTVAADGEAPGDSTPSPDPDTPTPQSVSLFPDWLVVDPHLEGLDVLWTTALEATSPNVASCATALLVSAYVTLAPSLRLQEAIIREQFISKCMDVMSGASAAQPDGLRVERALLLLEALVAECERVDPQASPSFTPDIVGKRTRSLPSRSPSRSPTASPPPPVGDPLTPTRAGGLRIALPPSPAAVDPVLLRPPPLPIASGDRLATPDGALSVRCTNAAVFPAPEALFVVVVPSDATVGDLRAAVGAKLSLPGGEVWLSRRGLELPHSGDATTLLDANFKPGSRLSVAPVGHVRTGSGVADLPSPGLSTPPITPSKDDQGWGGSLPPPPTDLQRQASATSVSSTGSKRLSDMAAASFPKTAHELRMSAMNRSPARTPPRAAAPPRFSFPLSTPNAGVRMVPMSSSEVRRPLSARTDPHRPFPRSLERAQSATESAAGLLLRSEPREVHVGHRTPQQPRRPGLPSSSAARSASRGSAVRRGDLRLFPSRLLANNTKHFDRLLGMLELPAPVPTQVWRLVSTLPPNRRLLHAIKTLQPAAGGGGVPWDDLLADASDYRLLYSLRLVEGVALGKYPLRGGKGSGHSPTQRGAGVDDGVPAGELAPTADGVERPVETWCAKFAQVGGAARLQALLRSRDTAVAVGGDSGPAEECASLLAKLLAVVVPVVDAADPVVGLACEDAGRLLAATVAADDSRPEVATQAVTLLHTCLDVDAALAASVVSAPDLLHALLVSPHAALRSAVADLVFATACASPGSDFVGAVVPLVVGAHAGAGGRLGEACRLLCRLVWRGCEAGAARAHTGLFRQLVQLVASRPAAESGFEAVPATALPQDSVSLGVGAPSIPSGVAAGDMVAYMEGDGAGSEGVVDEALLGALTLLRALLYGDARWPPAAAPPGDIDDASLLAVGFAADLPDAVVKHCLMNTAGASKATTAPSRRAAYALLYEFATASACARAARGTAADGAVGAVVAVQAVLNAELAEAALERVARLVFSHFSSVVTANGKDWGWEYDPADDVRAPCGYVGLYNPGCVCYANSVLQQLFNVPTFRQGVLQYVAGAEAGGGGGEGGVASPPSPDDTELLNQLRTMFGFLQESERRAFSPVDFAHAFKDFDGNPTDVRVQQDADEFLSVLLDRVDRALGVTSAPTLVQSTLRGSIENQIAGTCGHVSRRAEDFTVLSVAVSGCATVEDALAAHTAGEDLSGDNAYECSACQGAKVAAVKRVCLADLPPTLVLHLKRFEFNLDTFTKQKLNTRCAFGRTLDLWPYTEGGLRGEDPPHPRPHYHYALVGVVVHIGTSEAGHYFSFVKERGGGLGGDDDSWLEFNDHVVRPYDPAGFEADCFGGEDVVWRLSERTGRPVPVAEPRIQNAYMLVYERVGEGAPPLVAAGSQASLLRRGFDKLAALVRGEAEGKAAEAAPPPPAVGGMAPTASEVSTAESLAASGEPETPGMPTHVYRAVWSENARVVADRAVFDALYGQLLRDLVSYAEARAQVDLALGTSAALPALDFDRRLPYALPTSPTGNDDDSVDSAEDAGAAYAVERFVFQAAVMYFLRTVAHSVHTSAVPHWEAALSGFMRVHTPAAAWFATLLADQEAVTETVLLQCRSAPVRAATAHLATASAAVLYPHERGFLTRQHLVVGALPGADAEQQFVAAVPRLAATLLSIMPYAHEHWRRFEPFMSVVASLADLGPDARVMLLQVGAVHALIDILLGELSPWAPRSTRRSSIDDSTVVPSWGPVLHTLALLVCTCAPPGQAFTARRRDAMQRDLGVLREAATAWGEGEGEEDEDAAVVRLRIAQLEAALPLCEQGPPSLLPGAGQFQLHEQEVALLTDKAFVRQVVQFALQTPAGQHGAPHLMVHLSWNNKAASVALVNALVGELDVAQHDQMAPILACLEPLLALEDLLQATRVHLILSNVIDSARYYRNRFPSFTENLIQFINTLLHDAESPAAQFLQGEATKSLAWTGPWIAAQTDPTRAPTTLPDPTTLFVSDDDSDVGV